MSCVVQFLAGLVCLSPAAPQAVLCAGPFHVVSWATGALDAVRREVWRQELRVNLTDTTDNLPW